MKSTIKKLLLALILCALTSMNVAAKTVPSAEIDPVAETATQVKTPEAPKTLKSMRLGYVDVNRINNESILGKTSQTQAKDKQQKLKTQIESRRKQLDKQKSAIEGKLASLTAAQREAKAREFQKKIEEFQKFGLNAEKELQNLQSDLAKKLFETTEQAAIGYGKANNLSLIIVKQELLYLSNEIDTQDVTDGIIKLLNEKETKK